MSPHDEFQPEEAGYRRGCPLSTALLLLLVVFLGGLVALGRASGIDDLGLSEHLPWISRQRIGLLAGHWQSDSGAICPDGLQEVEVTLAVAEASARTLRARGYRVDLLSEYDESLSGYKADALVAIHCDSCVAELSGFKVARAQGSYIPEIEDRLVQKLYTAYAAETGLAPHRDTITPDMHQYHVFRLIAPETPAAIIEIGFLGGDRHLLTREQDRVAAGIARGIIAFLEH